MFILRDVSSIKKRLVFSEGRKSPDRSAVSANLGRTPGQCLQKRMKTLQTLRISVGLLHKTPRTVFSAFAAHLGELTDEEWSTHSAFYFGLNVDR